VVYRDDIAALAGVYDQLAGHARRPSGDIDFYVDLARQCGGPVLELGCGTGRVLLAVAETGAPCVGVDLSPDMLAQLDGKDVPDNVRVVQAPMQQFSVDGGPFRLIYSAFRPFMHMVTVADQLACLGGVHRHLAPDGVFAFDVSVPGAERLAIDRIEPHEDMRVPGDDGDLVRHAGMVHDGAGQTFDIHVRFQRQGAGGVTDLGVSSVKLRYFFRWELEHLLARAGFAIDAVYGAADRRPYDAESKDMYVIAKPLPVPHSPALR